MSLNSTPYVISALQHSAALFRQTLNCLIAGTGVVGSTDLEVKEHSASLTIEVAAGYVFVPGTQGETPGQRVNAGTQHATYSAMLEHFTSQGVYLAVAPSATLLTVAEGNSSNPRIDLVYACVQDAEKSGSFNQALLGIVTGTPAGSPSPPTPPENSVVLAQIKVEAKAKKIETANITDKRPHTALGAVGPYAAVTRSFGSVYEEAGPATVNLTLEDEGSAPDVEAALYIGGEKQNRYQRTYAQTSHLAVPWSFRVPAGKTWQLKTEAGNFSIVGSKAWVAVG